MTIDDFQSWTRSRDAQTGWDRLPLAQLVSHLSEEVGELVRSINRVYEYRGDVRDEHVRNISVELVDAAWFLFKIANRFGVSLDDALASFARREDSLPPDKYESQLLNALQALGDELAKANSERQRKGDAGT